MMRLIRFRLRRRQICAHGTAREKLRLRVCRAYPVNGKLAYVNHRLSRKAEDATPGVRARPSQRVAEEGKSDRFDGVCGVPSGTFARCKERAPQHPLPMGHFCAQETRSYDRIFRFLLQHSQQTAQRVDKGRLTAKR